MTQGPHSGAPLIHIDASPGLHQASAGDGVVYTLTVTNLSDESQSQAVAVEGLPRAWVTVDFDASRQALPREQRNAIVTVSVPDDAESGALNFRVIATAGDERAAADCVLQVEGVAPAVAEESEDAAQRPPAPGLALTPSEVSLESGGEATTELRLAVRNVGTRETEYSLALGGLERTWYELPEKLRVAVGETIDTRLVLHPPAAASTGVYPFLVRAIVDAAPDIMSDTTGELTILAPAAVPSEPEEPAPSQERATAAAATTPPEIALGPSTTFRFGPGQVVDQASIAIQNRTRLLEGYSVGIEGLPEGWYALPVSELRLDPGGSQQVALRLNPTPGSEHPAGDYPFRVRVTPHGSPDAFAEVGGTLSVVGTTAFDALVAPLQAQGRRERYKVTLRNVGTQPISLWIEGSDPAGMCRFDYPPPPNLEPGEERVLPVKVGVRRNRLVGRAETYDFGLRVLPAGGESSSARNFDARLIHQPYLTGRMLKWTVIIALAVIAIGIVIGIGPGRLLGGGDWFRCRFRGTASYCRPSTRVIPRIEHWQPSSVEFVDVVALLGGPPTARAAGRRTPLRGAVTRRAARRRSRRDLARRSHVFGRPRRRR
jgi:uncharacterized membrane protein